VNSDPSESSFTREEPWPSLHGVRSQPFADLLRQIESDDYVTRFGSRFEQDFEELLETRQRPLDCGIIVLAGRAVPIIKIITIVMISIMVVTIVHRPWPGR